MSNFRLMIALAAMLVPSAALAATQAPVIDDRFCQALTKHVPSADVAYQAGVDVHGKPVIQADLPPEQGGTVPLAVPQELTLPLTVDMLSFLKLDTATLPASAMKRNDIQLGTLTLRGDQLLFNNQPLTSAQQDNLAVLCLKPTR